MAKVLVTTARMMYSLDTIRILHRAGHEVYAADSVRMSAGLYSRYVKKHFIHPKVSEESEKFIDFLLKIVDDYKIDIIIPGFEDTFVLAYYLDRFKGKAKLLLSDYSVLTFLHDKYSVSKLARALDIPSPKTVLLRDFEQNDWSFPVIIKPRRNRGAIGIKVIESVKSLKEIGSTVNADEYMIQQLLPKTQFCITGMAYNGKLLSKVVYKNIREYPEEGGFGTYRLTCHVPEIDEYVKRIVEELNYTGYICTDFLYDEFSNTYYLTDVNPRMSPGVYVGYAAGVNFPKMYVNLLEDPESVKAVKPKIGVGSYTSPLEFGWFLAVLFKGKFKKLKGFFKRDKGMLDDVWDIRDPIPFFAIFGSMLFSAVIGPLMGGQQESYYLGCLYDRKYFPDSVALEELRKKYKAV
ncbi:MAG: ATP-utilizing protein [Thermotogae bacterium]|nr:MAG: ATP-utilizing protein [Thermotogota bacterium]